MADTQEFSYEDAVKPPPDVPVSGNPQEISYEDATKPYDAGETIKNVAGAALAGPIKQSIFNIANAFGDSVQQSGGDISENLYGKYGGDFVDSLRKTGMFDHTVQNEQDFNKGYLYKNAVPAIQNMLADFNQGAARYTAAAANLAATPFNALGAAIGQTTQELPKPLGELLEYETSRGDILAGTEFKSANEFANMPRVPRTVADAEAKGVIGTTEGQFQGVEPLSEAQHVKQTVAESEINPAPPIVSQETTQPFDIHTAARNVDPETFAQYDRLSATKDDLASQLSTAAEARTADIDAQIAEIQQAKQGGYGKLQSLIEKRNEIASQDTPEMADIRQKIQETDYAMRDLAPQVSQAYRTAGEFAPQEAGAQEGAAPQERGAEAAPEPLKPGSEAGSTPVKPIEEQRQAIISDFTQRASVTGRPQEEINSAAQIEAAFFQTLGEQYPKYSAEEWYNRERADIKGPRKSALVLGQETPELKQAKGGAITLATDSAKAIIKSLKNANASTWIHETGHHYTDILFRLAKEDDAPQAMKDDAAALKKWMGLPEDADVRETQNGKYVHKAQLEKVARGFERYLMEGTAPSRALANVFALYKRLLTAIYKTVENLRAPISDDVRDVFDRLLSANPEKTTIAPDHEPGSLLANIHERDAEEATPENAETVADNIRAEVDKTALTHDKETANALKSAENEGEPTTATVATGTGTTAPGEGTIAQEPSAVNAGGNKTSTQGYEPIPRKPLSLADFVKKNGGVKDEGGDVLALLGKKDGRLIRPKAGRTLDDMALKASEAGYFPEKGEERPSIEEFLAKLHEDINGKSQYSAHDVNKVLDYNNALARNAETDRLTHEFGIDTKGKTSAQVYDEIAEHMSKERQVEEASKLAESHEKELAEAEEEAKKWAESRGEAWEPEETVPEGQSRTLEDLENEREQEIAARGAQTSASSTEQPGVAAADQGQIQGGAGQRGSGVESSGRAEPPISAERSNIANESARSASDEPTPAKPTPKSANESFGENKSNLLDKAGNLRPDLITSDQSVRDALYEYADKHPELTSHQVVTDQQVAEMADAMGVDARELNVQKLRDLSVNDGVPLAVRVRGGAKMLVQNLQSAIDLMGKETPTDEDAVKFLEAKERALMMMETMSGVANEMGRAFRAFNNFKKEYDMKNVDEIADLFQKMTGKTLDDIKNEMKNGSLMKTPQQLAKFMQKSYMPDFWDKMIEYRNDCLLSGPITHFYYTTAGYSIGLFKPLQKLAGVASQAIEEAGGKQITERMYAREAAAEFTALVQGSVNGIKALALSWKLDAELVLPGELTPKTAAGKRIAGMPQIAGVSPEFQWMPRQSYLAQGGAISKLAGQIMAPVPRALQALHSLRKTVDYQQEKAALAVREALDKGFAGGSSEYNKFVADRIQNPTSEMMQKAGVESVKNVGREKIDYNSRAGQLTNFINKYPEAKALFPFMKMEYNFKRLAYRDNSLLGLLDGKTKADLAGVNGDVARNMAKGKITLGTAVLGSGAGLAMLGVNNGSGPSDPKAYKAWRLTHTPYSLQFGGITIPHTALGPVIGNFMSLSANAVEGAHEFSADDVSKSSFRLIEKVGAALFHGTLIQQVNEVHEALFTPEQHLTSFLQQYAASFLPYSTGLDQLNRAFVDPDSRRVKSLGAENLYGIPEALEYKLPGFSYNLEPNYDMFGRPITNSSSYDQYADDPVVKKLESLNTGVSRLSDKIKGVQLTEEQYSEFSRQAGQMTYAKLWKTMRLPSFDRLTPAQQLIEINRNVTAARQSAASTVMKIYPDIMRQAIAQQRIARFGNPAVNNAENEAYEDANNP